MAGRFSVETVFKAIDRISRPVMRMSSRVRRATDSMTRGFKQVDRATKAVMSTVKSLSLAAVVSLAVVSGALADVIGTGADFEQTLVNAAVKFPGEIRKGTDAFGELESAARNIGRTTEFTAQQGANAINFLAMAGFDAKQSLSALPQVVDLATAAQVDLGTASDIATDSLGAFNLMTKDSVQLGKNLARINDVLATTSTSANTTIESLFETIKDGAPVATTAGASLETFAAMAGVLANSGIKASRGGTTLKNIFLSLSAPTKEASKILRGLGVSTQDANGNFLDVIDVMENLKKSMSGLGSAQKSAVLDGIFGKIPIAGVNILLAAGSERLREFRSALEGATGSSSNMADIMRNTLRGSINALKSAIESVKLTMFSMNDGPLKEVVDRMTDWVRANENMIASRLGEFLLMILNNIEAIVLAIRQIAGVLVFLFAFSIGVKAIGAALLITQTAMAAFAFLAGGLPKVLLAVRVAMLALNLAMFANPVGLIVGGIAALVGLAAAVIAAWGPVTDFFGEMFDKVNGIISPALSLFGFSGDDESEDSTGTAAANVASPQARTATSIQESRTTNTAELKISGAPEGSKLSTAQPVPGVSLQLSNSGGFE